LINTARGSLVDEAALFAALAERRPPPAPRLDGLSARALTRRRMERRSSLRWRTSTYAAHRQQHATANRRHRGAALQNIHSWPKLARSRGLTGSIPSLA
jgi:hypothetical protein